jgi:Na+/H+-dicarboxylate symporter
MLLGIFPANSIEPFATGNTLQIIFMAIVVGIALIYLDRQTSSIAKAIDQVNVLVQFLMQFITKLVPYVIFLVVLSMIWSGNLTVLVTAWKLFVALVSAMLLIGAVFVVVTCVRMKVSPVVLIRKNTPTFLMSLTTASSAAAFGTLVDTCNNRFGIDESVVRFGVPLGMVIQKPISAAFFLLLLFFFATQYEISCSLGWICAAVFVSAVVAIAAPPVPGGAAVAFSALFAPMGIPAEALAIALAIDVAADFFVTAFQMSALQLSLVNISARMGIIEGDILRDPEA